MSTLLESFNYVRPTNLDQLNLLVMDYITKGYDFTFSAGGTDIIPRLKKQIFNPENLISLSGISDLKGIEKKGEIIIIGALTTLDDLANHDLIKKYFPTLAHAAHKVASPQIRNRATLGGNIMVDNRCSYINQSSLNRDCHAPCFKADGDICHIVKRAKRGDEVLCQARFVSDTAPVLLLLEANITIMGQGGLRKIKLNDLYLNDGIDNRSLRKDELITKIEVKIPENESLHYEKLAIRNALDFPSLGVAVCLSEQNLSVALTGLNPRPGLFKAKIKNYNNFDEMVSDICDQALAFAVTYNQDFFPRAYRKSMIPVFIKRGISNILKEKK
ncbi:MAG: FAD binding domain-containing protein [Emcibacter sp.]|nr:FAD binding domain-containing protein [Emcibacter sp.]